MIGKYDPKLRAPGKLTLDNAGHRNGKFVGLLLEFKERDPSYRPPWPPFLFSFISYFLFFR